MIPLYDVAAQYQAAFRELSEMDDMTPDIIEDSLSLLYGNVEDKAVNVAKFFQGLDAQAKAIREAEIMMAARRKAIESKSERLKAYLLDNMKKCGISKVECPYFILSVQKTAGSVVIDDPTAIPADYMREKVTYEADKSLIRLAISDGFGVPGAHIEEGYSLRIK
jgi:hypothetical protein